MQWLLVALYVLGLEQVNAEQSLSETIDKIKPGIVAVGTFMVLRNPQSVMLGTGFAIGDGSLIVTNAHVLPSEIDSKHLEKLTVFVRRNKKNEIIVANLVAIDKQHDIAILKLSKSKLSPLQLSKTKNVREGQLYAFTGYPIGMILGLYPVTHRGIISAISPIAIPAITSKQLDVKIMRHLQHPYNVYQLDATAYPGNSGSPLYNVDTGKVIGVINKVFVKESKENVLSKPSGITYAIPIEYVKKLLTEKDLL